MCVPEQVAVPGSPGRGSLCVSDLSHLLFVVNNQGILWEYENQVGRYKFRERSFTLVRCQNCASAGSVQTLSFDTQCVTPEPLDGSTGRRCLTCRVTAAVNEIIRGAFCATSVSRCETMTRLCRFSTSNLIPSIKHSGYHTYHCTSVKELRILP